MKQTVFVTLLTAALAVVTLNTSRAAEAAGPHKLETAAKVASVTLDVEGVGCASCTLSIRGALKNLEGVKDVKAGSSKEQVVVEYDKRKLTEDQILATVKKAGYGARVHK